MDHGCDSTTCSPGSSSPYDRAQAAGRAAVREEVLRAAFGVLELEGFGALTMRRVADHVGASTTVLYNTFESKNGLVDAMVSVGHELLASRLRELDTEQDPGERLRRSAHVYRSVAREEPVRYQLMFGALIAGYEPGPQAAAAARDSFAAFVDIVRSAIAGGVLVADGDPEFIAEVLTAAAHGAVSLEISGQFRDPTMSDRRFTTLTSAAVVPFLAGAPQR